MHYPVHIIKFGMSLPGIETLGEGTVKFGISPSGIKILGEGTILMGNLEKVWWVVLKSEYSITPYGELENELYHLNNDSGKFKKNWFVIEGIHRQMFYKQSENIHDSRFIDGNISEIHALLKSDCNIINLHLETNYKFDSDNKYKYYNPNLIRNNGLIKKKINKYIVISRQVLSYVLVLQNNLINASSNKIVDQAPVNSPKNKRTRNTQSTQKN